jgi:BlaI family penicillinase repressor
MKRQANLPTPTDREFEILDILWSSGPSTVRQVHDLLSPSKPSQYTTTLKIIQIMTEKRLLRRLDRNGSHVYRPLIDREYVRQRLAGTLMNRAFGGSLRKLMVGALGSKKTSEEELDELRHVLDEYQKGNKR